MRITEYKTILNEEKLNILVKEKSFNYETKPLTSPNIVVDLLNNCFNLKMQSEEYVYMICLNNKGSVLGVFEVSHGTVNASLVQPREVFIKALLCGASQIILAHNHPSGDTSPSTEDIKVYQKMKEASDIMAIPLVDFLIIGDDYVSFIERQIF